MPETEKSGRIVISNNNRPKSDKGNLCLLIFLYTLQGLPKSLCRSIPMLLKQRQVDYFDLAVFSATALPFSLKLAWAPIVDCFYSPKLGQRKSWLVPSQFAIGFCFLVLGIFGDDWLGPDDGDQSTVPQIRKISVVVAIMNILAATQDIAVDGWALTMLTRFLPILVTCVSNIYDHDFNIQKRTLHQVQKNEERSWAHDNMPQLQYFMENNADKTFENIMPDCPHKQGFGVIEAVTPMKLMEYGVDSYALVLICIPVLPIQAFLPFIMKTYIVGSNCLNCYIHAIIYRCCFAVLLGIFLFLAPYVKLRENTPFLFYIIMYLLLGLEDMGDYGMSVSFNAFAAKVSDADYGGIYITLLNTASFFSTKYPEVLALSLVNMLTVESCLEKDVTLNVTENMDGNNENRLMRVNNIANISSMVNTSDSTYLSIANNTILDKTTCSKAEIVDGYFIEVFFGVVFTVLWLGFWARKHIIYLQRLSDSAWFFKRTDKRAMNEEML